MASVAVLKKVNHWRGSSTYICGVSPSLDAGKARFDKEHNHRDGKWCDYCRAKWDDRNGWSVRQVDHDGASVEYIVEEYEVKS